MASTDAQSVNEAVASEAPLVELTVSSVRLSSIFPATGLADGDAIGLAVGLEAKVVGFEAIGSLDTPLHPLRAATDASATIRRANGRESDLNDVIASP
jgi:hypothetical protein